MIFLQIAETMGRGLQWVNRTRLGVDNDMSARLPIAPIRQQSWIVEKGNGLAHVSGEVDSRCIAATDDDADAFSAPWFVDAGQ
jgi:hypothetical protein